MSDWSFDDEPAPVVTLRGRQPEQVDKVEQDIATGFTRLLFCAAGGVGKSTIFAELAKRFWLMRSKRALVLINRESLVRQSAERIANETGLEVAIEMAGETASPYAPVVVASVQTLGRVNRLTGFTDDHFGLVVPDECFPSNVRVDGKPISEIKVGDLVWTFNHAKQTRELGSVIAKSRSIPRKLIEITCNGRRIISTVSHPFFTHQGYRRASDLSVGDKIAAENGVLNMRSADYEMQIGDKKVSEAEMLSMQTGRNGGQKKEGTGAVRPMRCFCRLLRIKGAIAYTAIIKAWSRLLQRILQADLVERKFEKEDRRNSFGLQSEAFATKNENQQSNEQPIGGCENGGGSEGKNVFGSRRQWAPDGPPRDIIARSWECADGICNIDNHGVGQISVTSVLLQGRHRDPRRETSNRGGWENPQAEEVAVFGSQKNRGIKFFRVDGVKILEPGSDGKHGGVCPDGYVYNLEIEGNNNYFADGFLVHNCHLSAAPQWLRIMNYFHYGAESLVDGWVRPKDDGSYQAKSVVVGFTATPDDELLDWYQHVTVKYPYYQAVAEGWLVPPVQKSIPVKIDMRKKRIASGPNGRDFITRDLTESLIPVLEELADQVVKEASDRKTIAFLPSVDTARLLSDALCRRGLDAVFVSGSCEDGEEKTEHFRAGGRGSVLCNAQIYNFGIDFVDVDCVAWFRATISRQFYLQGLFRGTRVLRGVVDGLATPEERKAAIAASAKPNFLILDPLFVSDRIDLCDAYDLFAETPEVKEKMKERGELSQAAAEKAERDFAKALEKAARKVANREARVIDPLSWSVSIGIDRLKDFRPERAWEELPVTPEQRDFLAKHHIALTKTLPDGTVQQVIDNRGKAQLIIGTYLKRLTLKLATPEQLNFMARLGLEFTPQTTKEEATAAINRKIRR